MAEYRVIEKLPSADDYNRIRVGAGLKRKDVLAVAQGLKNSLFCVCIEIEDRTIGMGRVVGDGGLHFDVVDIAVLPDHQGQGLGHKIMAAIMQYLKENAPSTAFVCLMTEEKMVPFYERYGFSVRGPDRPGMSLIVK